MNEETRECGMRSVEESTDVTIVGIYSVGVKT